MVYGIYQYGNIAFLLNTVCFGNAFYDESLVRHSEKIYQIVSVDNI